MSADHGHGSCAERQKRIYPEKRTESDRDDILHDDEERHDKEKDDDRLPAFFKGSERCLIPDRREKKEHRDIRKRLVECESHPGKMRDQKKDGKNDAADHRDRKTESFQKTDLLFQEITCQQDKRNKRNCPDHRKVYRHGICQ